MKALYPVKSLLVSLIACFCTCFAYSQVTSSFTVDASATDYRLIKAIQLSAGRVGVLVATANNTNIYFQVFSGGTRTVNVNLVSQIVWPNSNHQQLEINALASVDDNVFITYNSSDGGPTMTSDVMRYLVINASGTVVRTGQVNTTDPGNTQTRFASLVNLSNGKVLILFSRSDNASYAFRIFNTDGTAVTPADNVFATASGLGGSVYTTQVGANNNGRFLFTTYYYGGNLKGYLFNNNGTAVSVGGVSPFNVDATVTNEYYNQKIIGLANGNFIVYYNANNISYYKVLDASGNTVQARMANPLGNWAMSDAFPDNTPGSEGYYLAQGVAQNAADPLNPYSKVVLKKYNQSYVLQSTTELEGYLISPFYTFIAGNGGGYAYVYSYYRTFAVDNSCPGYEYSYPTGDADIKGQTQALITTLPVNLLSFNVKAEGNKAILQWKTASEQNSKAFIIQRSSNAGEWQTLATVEAAGNSQQVRSYQFVDDQPGARNYYRLVQTDLDNKQNYSNIVMALFGKQAIFRVYPNPATSYTLIELPEQLEADIKLSNDQGQVVYRNKNITNIFRLELKSLAKGLYKLQVQQNGNTYTKKILVR